ncbi:MAG: TM1802 family CRISPR-associated protein, partial [Candidatus Jordarchaeales archaeon]
QHNKGDEKKAVLNKINFEGMSAERVKLLANYVLEGLRNYKVLNDRNEATYACMKMMLDRNLDALRNPIDNVFYILSGYAYVTLQAMRSER